MHYFLPAYLGGTFFPLFDVSERDFFSGGGGGWCTCTQCTPPCVRACSEIDIYLYIVVFQRYLGASMAFSHGVYTRGGITENEVGQSRENSFFF